VSELLAHQVHLDLRLIPSAVSYHAGSNKSRFITPVPYYGNRVVRLLTGTMATLSTSAGTITNISVANPTVITSAGHGLVTGMSITIAGSNSTPTVDGTRTITRINDDTFTVAVNVTVLGTTGTWTSADKTGFMATGNFVGGFDCVLGVIPEMSCELSEVVPRDEQGNPTLQDSVTHGVMTIYHGTSSGFTVEVEHVGPGRATEDYEYAPDLTDTPDRERDQFSFNVGAAAERCTITIGEDGYKPVHVHGIRYDVEYGGAQR
jgi:hypothetical protein